MTKISYKTILAGSKPYPEKEKDDYLGFLKTNKDKIYYGETGIYLGRRININDQNLYFPFIDIDGNNNEDINLKNDNKIQSAILNASIVYKSFKKLRVEKYFSIIATGNTGFRMLSNILLNEDDYKAFVEFIKKEIPQVIDLQPTEDLQMPHRLFVYNGHSAQNPKKLVDRHSAVIPSQMFEGGGTMTPEYYKEITKGKPDPDDVIRFVERFLNFKPISDLNALGEFGKKLKVYKKFISDIINFKSFDVPKYRGNFIPVSLQVIEKKLQEENIPCKIKNIKGQNSISFYGLPCPICKKVTANAWAYPPYYKLKCFNSDCPGYREKGGISLIKWAGLASSNKEIASVKNELKRNESSSNKSNDFCLKSPTEFESLDYVWAKINNELANNDNVLFILTPGTGKSHLTLKHIAENMASDKLVLYSCYNKKLRDEAYKKIIEDFSANPDHIHVLESREDLCHRKEELKHATSKGFSPKRILCKHCPDFNKCQYYRQRKNLGPGIYFITHHMLQYLEDIIPSPNLLILDEDILKGFLVEDGCSENQMRTLAKILDGDDYSLIDQIHKIGHSYVHQAIEKSETRIINSKKLIHSEDTILHILAIHNDTTEDEIKKRISDIILKFDSFSKKKLYEKEVWLKAINWIKGLVSENRYSYLLVTVKGEIYFNLKYTTPLGYSSTPIKILDATGNKQVAQALTGREIKVIKGDVKWDSRKIHIKRSINRSEMRTIKDKHLKGLLSIALKKMNSEKILVVTYKEWKEKVIRFCKEIDSDRQYMDYHFQGPRGVNDYKECDGVLVLGLPYPNINSAYQDAHIIFPNANSTDNSNDYYEELKNSWIDSVMMWELLQNIHRIRPINRPSNKNNSEVVIISSRWPEILPKPDELIDKSKNKNWKDLIIQRLDPYVKEFGFLNSDIRYLANVYIKKKGKKTTDLKSAINFRKKINELIKLYELSLKFQKKGNLEAINCLVAGKIDSFDEKYKLNFERKRVTSLIENVLYQRLPLIKDNRLIQRYNNLSCRSSDITISLPGTKQWTEILIYFKEKYNNFEKFKIKLPSSNGQKVNGVGNRQSVIDFYRQLNQFKIFGNINLDSYETLENRIISIDPIPDDYFVVYVPNFTDIPDDKKSENIVYIGSGNDITPVSTVGDPPKFKAIFSNLIENKTLITNNGKELAKILIQSGLNRCEINDVAMNERIIINGDVPPRVIKPEDLFKQYELCEDTDLSLLIPQLYKVWECQQKIIDDQNLKNVVDLEKRTIWITANLELTGIGIDVIGMLEYQEEFGSKLPHEHKVIDRYFNLVEDDYRIRDKINQVNAVTGRFTFRVLHTVKKDGPLRSFFRAKDGYKFIIADYFQHEPRILFGLANDKKNIEAIREGRDIYIELIRNLTGKSLEGCKVFRSVGKQVILSLINGKSLYSLYADLKDKIDISMSQDEFIRFIESYYSAIFNWRKQIAQEARENGYITTLFGRRRNVTPDTSDPQLFNFPIQGTGADGFKLSLIGIDKGLKNIDAQIVHILHDEIIVEAKSEDVEDVTVIMKNSMEKSLAWILN